MSAFKEVLTVLTGEEPPFELTDVMSSSEIDDDTHDLLQDWCATNSKPKWATGLSMIEAADVIVEGAIENGNLYLYRGNWEKYNE